MLILDYGQSLAPAGINGVMPGRQGILGAAPAELNLTVDDAGQVRVILAAM